MVKISGLELQEILLEKHHGQHQRQICLLAYLYQDPVESIKTKTPMKKYLTIRKSIQKFCQNHTADLTLSKKNLLLKVHRKIGITNTRLESRWLKT